jgi:uncharacterized protein
MRSEPEAKRNRIQEKTMNPKTMTMYSASVPVFARMLTNLLGFLDKAEAQAATKKFDPQVYLTARLAPDMLTFTKQIQIACDAAKFGVSRLAGVDAPAFADDEASLAELRMRITKTIDFLQSVDASRMVGSDDRDIVVPRRDGSMTMKGEDYLKQFSMPNFYFHLSMAYALLRHNGVDLGKMDFLGKLAQ